jgi:2-methylisocitrate lyase-like PEP mutase family enzyme
MSAQIAEKLGFQAIGTSSAAMSNMLGHEDGEHMSFDELCFLMIRIKASSALPMTVDIESGYSRHAHEIAEHIEELAILGAVGVNIEDSIVNGMRTLIEANSFAQKLTEVTTRLKDKGVDVFVNVRTDAYLTAAGNPAAVSLERANLYQQAGADGIFVPGIEKPEEIALLVDGCALPINVMCMPGLPDFAHLKALGVKRISMGNFLFENMYQHLQHTLGAVADHQSFDAVF